MKLCVLGKESLDELEAAVRSHFTNVARKEVTLPVGDDIGGTEPPYRPSDLNKLVRAVPVADLRFIRFLWPVEDQQKYWRSKPARYLSHLMGHEGKGSLLSALKAKGLVTELVGGLLIDHGHGFAAFGCEAHLSPSGISDAGLAEVTKLVFAYIRMMQEGPTEEWVFKEMAKLSEMEYRYASSPDAMRHVMISENMHFYPPSLVMEGPSLFYEFGKDQIESLLRQLTPERLLVLVVGKECAASCPLEEPVYLTRYAVEPLAPVLQRWGVFTQEVDDGDSTVAATSPTPASAESESVGVAGNGAFEAAPAVDPSSHVVPKTTTTTTTGGGAGGGECATVKLHLPAPNPYVPERLDMQLPDAGAQQPVRLPCSNSPSAAAAAACTTGEADADASAAALVPTVPGCCKVWVLQELKFKVPKAFFGLRLTGHHLARGGLEALSVTHLYLRAVKEIINESCYDAEVAGLEYQISLLADEPGGGEAGAAVLLTVGGYVDKLPELLKHILRALRRPQLTRAAFDVAKTVLTRKQSILAANSKPYQQAIRWKKAALLDPFFSPTERLAGLTAVAYEDVCAVWNADTDAHRLFDDALVEGAAVGNVDRRVGAAWVRMVAEELNIKRGTGDEAVPGRRAAILPEKKWYRYEDECTNESDCNNAAVVYLQISAGDSSIEASAMANVLSNAVEQRFFDELRTKQQLGYAVFAFLDVTLATVFHLAFLVQSLKSPRYVRQRIDTFITQAAATPISEEEFNRHRLAVIAKLSEKPKNVPELFNRVSAEVFKRRFDFNRRERMAEYLRTVKYADFLTYYRHSLLEAPRFAVELRSKQAGGGPRASDPAAQMRRKLESALMAEAGASVDCNGENGAAMMEALQQHLSNMSLEQLQEALGNAAGDEDGGAGGEGQTKECGAAWSGAAATNESDKLAAVETQDEEEETCDDALDSNYVVVSPSSSSSTAKVEEGASPLLSLTSFKATLEKWTAAVHLIEE
eukprot:GHVU01035285.1.p1 GENE.GHVU01035285.1~~GHVU01035285.1.p1  ORF type:complete len:982 (-),score=230.56 GHVU01035285.1:1306-4251(-)